MLGIEGGRGGEHACRHAVHVLVGYSQLLQLLEASEGGGKGEGAKPLGADRHQIERGEAREVFSNGSGYPSPLQAVAGEGAQALQARNQPGDASVGAVAARPRDGAALQRRAAGGRGEGMEERIAEFPLRSGGDLDRNKAWESREVGEGDGRANELGEGDLGDLLAGEVQPALADEVVGEGSAREEGGAS